MIILLRSLSSNHALGGESVLLQNSFYEFALRRANDALRSGRSSSSEVKSDALGAGVRGAAERSSAELGAAERSGRGGLWDPLPIEGSTVGSGARSSPSPAFSAPTSVLLGGAASVSVESLAELRPPARARL